MHVTDGDADMWRRFFASVGLIPNSNSNSNQLKENGFYCLVNSCAIAIIK